MKINPNAKFLGFLALALVMPGVSFSTDENADSTDEDNNHDTDEPWHIASNTEVGRNSFGGKQNETPRGYTLHSSGDKTMGVAFRCDKGKLATYLAVKRINMHEMITWRSPYPRRWPVEFSINGQAVKSEEWVSLHGGSVYLVINQVTALRILDFAEDGLSIEIDAKGARPVTVELPPDLNNRFRWFRSKCGFKREHEAV